MEQLAWWQRGVIYQIYPRSFADSNGDGVGDLGGIIERLDYLQWLGVDAIWLSPHFPSPQADCGYDISDYMDVDPTYGTLEAFQQLLAEAHARGIRVILDLVLNHTSEEHSWFQASRRREEPYTDWYVWHDPAPDGGPPNDWQSRFGGPAWTYDELRGQYYYHFFLKEQPDLNWRNPEVKAAMWDVVRFWLDMGVDGFRLDAIDSVYEEPTLPPHGETQTILDLFLAIRQAEDNAARERLHKRVNHMLRYQHKNPQVHDLMQELRALVDEYPDRVLLGEAEEVAYHGDGTNELHLTFNFPLIRRQGPFTPTWIEANQRERLAALPPGAWPCNTLNNHDDSRAYSKFGDGTHDDEYARLSAALVLTLRGTPVLYNGEEIGMSDFFVEHLDQIRDTWANVVYGLAVGHEGIEPEVAFAEAARISRDRCRTPMQWRNAPNAGFSPAGATTWLPVNPNYAAGVNVAAQQDDPTSLLHFYRRLIHLRRETPALVAGDYQPLAVEAATCFAFLRTTDAQRCLVALNFGGDHHTLALDLEGEARLLLSTHGRAARERLAHLPVAPFEVYIAEVAAEG